MGESVRPYPVATIGNFDGHHIGHRALLQAVSQTARKAGGTALALTFDPHPVKILAPHVDLRFLTGPEEKLARFQDAGIDEVVFLEFSETFATLSPEAFVDQVLSQGLGLKELFVGQHFVFGHRRAGTIADLVALGSRYGFVVHPMAPVTASGGVVSSTRIRQLIQTGDVAQAALLLGRQYVMTGVVVPGVQRGQELGWRTANLPVPPDRVTPADGVYATVAVWNQRRYDSVAYIGTRPTFGVGERLLEVHLLDDACDLYGQQMAVEFVDLVRPDRQFSGSDTLSLQIARDVASARTMLQKHHEVLGKR
ncbi:MAG: bifunctional riboflavin kinase/FAD synthetase [Nitrospira sp.]|nr:bifunctional riboflavin kinase/FAD synthetase [Nitrospira sp.]MBH0180935.1 bifunctional riboflavin kinase/FAD synthetase [Nitrospira sp.]